MDDPYALARAEEWANYAEHQVNLIKASTGESTAASVDELFRAVAMSEMWARIAHVKAVRP